MFKHFLIHFIGKILIWKHYVYDFFLSLKPSHINSIRLFDIEKNIIQCLKTNTIIQKDNVKPKTIYYLIELWDSKHHLTKKYFIEHDLLYKVLNLEDPYLNNMNVYVLIKTLDSFISSERNRRNYFAITLVNSSIDTHIEIDITRIMSKFSNSISKENNMTVTSLIMLYNYLCNKSLDDNEYFLQLYDFDLNDTILVNDEYIFAK
ncbi:MAG: hypothetical protein EBU66_15830 [Bacteroidetes bacterium]|nr:hypothetical protein [Bacteroidota bacterium]